MKFTVKKTLFFFTTSFRNKVSTDSFSNALIVPSCGFLLSTPPDKSPAKKKKNKKPLSIDKMLKKFHKEKLQQLQMFNALNDTGPTMQAEVQDPPISSDPLLTLIGSASADDLLQAVKAAEQDFDLDGLLGEPQNVCSPSLEENGEALVASVTEKPPTLLPDGLPPTLEQHIKQLSQVLFDFMALEDQTRVCGYT